MRCMYASFSGCLGIDEGCCTKVLPCGLNEGDCDGDDQCLDELVCVKDSCPYNGTLSSNENGWDKEDAESLQEKGPAMSNQAMQSFWKK